MWLHIFFQKTPFGDYLGFRHGYSNNIPSPAIKYYRWRYRRAGELDWKDMHLGVGRHYVKQSPGMLSTFPVYSLGPHSKGGNGNLFEFKPSSPPGPDVMGKESKIIAPHGCCAGYEPNYDKLDDTRNEERHEKVTTNDVT